MNFIPATRRHRVRNASLALAAPGTGIAAPLSLTKGNRVVGGNASLTSLWAVVIALVLVWAFSTDRAAGIFGRSPWVVVRRNALASSAQSDADLTDRVVAIVEKIGALLGDNTRYNPTTFPPETDESEDRHKAWERDSRRRQQHERAIVARFFDESYAPVVAAATELHARGALTEEELRHLAWTIGTMDSGSTHGLSEVGPALMRGVQNLAASRERDA